MLITERTEKIFRILEVWFAGPDDHIPSGNYGYAGLILQDCKLPVQGFECRETRTLVIDLKQSLDEIWHKMDKKSCRYEITRAERDKVWADISPDYAGFYQMNKEFRKLKKLKGNPNLAYLETFGTLFMASVSDRWVAGQVYLVDSHTMRWLLGASVRLTCNDPLVGAANRALIWKAIQFAKGAGLEEFDMGGYYTGDDPGLRAVNFFKESFGGTLATRYVCRKDLSPVYHLVRRVVEKWM